MKQEWTEQRKQDAEAIIKNIVNNSYYYDSGPKVKSTEYHDKYLKPKDPLFERFEKWSGDLFDDSSRVYEFGKAKQCGLFSAGLEEALADIKACPNNVSKNYFEHVLEELIRKYK